MDAGNGVNEQSNSKYFRLNGLILYDEKGRNSWPGRFVRGKPALIRIPGRDTLGGLTRLSAGLQYPQKIPKNSGAILALERSQPWGPHPDHMSAKSPVPPPNVNKKPPCRHPRVQIVSRDEESEFVECKECGEIFESSEFKDMNIEDRIQDPDV